MRQFFPASLWLFFNFVVSTDSDTSRDARELDMNRSGSLEGSVYVSEHRRGSKAKLAHSLSTRSFDRTLEGNGEREPPDRDLDLDWCPDCGVSLEQFDEETLNLCIVVLSTFVHQSPSMAMPFLLRMLESVARFVIGLSSGIIGVSSVFGVGLSSVKLGLPWRHNDITT